LPEDVVARLTIFVNKRERYQVGQGEEHSAESAEKDEEGEESTAETWEEMEDGILEHDLAQNQDQDPLRLKEEI
jgi:hypothetical protein